MYNIQTLLTMMRSIIFLAGTFFILVISAAAQQQSVIPDAALNDMLSKFREIQSDIRMQQQVEKELNTIVDQAAEKLNKWLLDKQKEQNILQRNYKAGYTHSNTDLNLFPLWEAMPAPVPSLPETKQVDFNGRFEAYINKVTMMKKHITDMLQQHLGKQRIEKQLMMKDSKAMADRNVFVQQMGGADALIDMSEEEKKQSAKNVAENFKNNPVSVAGMNNDGMNTMAQRMMNDQKYREAYNKMTDEQKAAELKKYMGNTIEERNDKDFEASVNTRNSTYSAANIELLLGKCLQQMQDAAKPYSEGTVLTNNFFGDIYKRLDDWYTKTYSSLPETVTHEKKGLDILIKCKETILYSFQKKEALARTILWNLLKSNTQIAFGEFNDFIGSYQWGKEKEASLIDGKYTDHRVAQAIISIYDEMIRMTSEAERITRMFKGQQEQYELILK